MLKKYDEVIVRDVLLKVLKYMKMSLMTMVTMSVLCICIEHFPSFFFCQQKLLAVTGVISVFIKLQKIMFDMIELITAMVKETQEAFMFSVGAY